MQNAIELHNVSKRFGRNLAVDSLDLTVPAGSIYGFIGPNGSGKTTTLRMILRIFQPDKGQVVVLGNPHGKVADDRLGYLPEERGLYKRMKVRDILAYYAKLKGLRNCRKSIDQWLVRLDAVDWSERRIEALSKGMAQKIQFIAAVVARPQLVILDEPFSGLDPVNMESMRDSVLQLRRDGTTVVFSTHDMDMAENMCDTIFMIFRGKKVLDGSLASIQQQYATDIVRVGFSDPGQEVDRIQGAVDVRKSGEFFDFRVADMSRMQNVLSQLVETGSLTHFEVVKPSLHDIFVRIAAPERYQNGAAAENGAAIAS